MPRELLRGRLERSKQVTTPSAIDERPIHIGKKQQAEETGTGAAPHATVGEDTKPGAVTVFDSSAVQEPFLDSVVLEQRKSRRRTGGEAR
jgi:hypothetical protein